MPDYAPANKDTTGQVMKFILNDDLKNPAGDASTVPGMLDTNSGRGDIIIYPDYYTDVADLFLKETILQAAMHSLQHVSISPNSLAPCEL